MLGGEYPQYQAFVPAEFSAIAEIPAAPFAEAVKRVALVAERDTPVRPTFSGGRVGLEEGTGDQAQATEGLDVSFDGEDGFQIAFNPHYLLDGISAIGADTALIRWAWGTTG